MDGELDLPVKRAAFVLALAAAAAGCSKSVAIAVNLISVSCAGTDILAPDGGVQFLRFTVSSDAGVLGTPETVAVASQTLQLPQTPLGTLNVEVDALSENSPTSPILAQGSSGPFTVPSDGSVSQQTVTVFLRAVDRSVPTNDKTNPNQCSTMKSPRAYHSQVLLANGQVLLYGGVVYGPTTPTTGTTINWSDFLGIPASVASGSEEYLQNAEIYDPQTGDFTATGNWKPVTGDDTPTERAFAQLIAFTNGDAVAVGGEVDPATLSNTAQTEGQLLIPAWNEGIFSESATPAWTSTPTHSAHAEGCLAADSAGQALLAGGYTGTPANTAAGITVGTTAIAESFDPTAWPPLPKLAGALPDVAGPAGAVAEQACSGFDGVKSLFQSVVAEVGGGWIDPSGNGWISQTYYLEQFTSSTGVFAPFLASGQLLGAQLAEPRVRAKAAPMIVTQPTSADGGTTTEKMDALLVTGGFTCTPAATSSIDCAPVFAEGADAGPLGNPPDSYFWNDAGPEGSPLDVGKTTELIAFPPKPGEPGQYQVVQGTEAALMSVERIDHCMVPLPDGRVVIIGGLSGATASSFGTTASIEVASDDPTGTPPSDLPKITMHEAAQSLVTSRAGMACTLLPDGSILVTGGITTDACGATNTSHCALNGTTQTVKTLSSAEIYRPLPLAAQ